MSFAVSESGYSSSTLPCTEVHCVLLCIVHELQQVELIVYCVLTGNGKRNV